MINNRLLAVLQSALGNSLSNNSSGDYNFFCPHCDHHKQKLVINIETQSNNYQYFNCWVCNYKGRNLYNLITQYAPQYLSTLQDAIKHTGKNIFKPQSTTKKIINTQLPKQFKPLYIEQPNNPQYSNALYYTLNRGITYKDIKKYNIHYCTQGKYDGRIIFPSYNNKCEVDFFVARSYKGSKLKYLMPNLSKNIIFNQIFISWKYPLYLCQGVMDAISIGDNAIPLLGKFMSNYLKQSILTNKPERVYVVLDNDAMQDATKIANTLRGWGVQSYITELPQGQDPSSLGHNKIMQCINNSSLFNKQFMINKIFKGI